MCFETSVVAGAATGKPVAKHDENRKCFYHVIPAIH